MKKTLFALLAVFFIIIFVSALSFYHYSITPCKSSRLTVKVHIPRGASLQKISFILKEKGLIEETFKFKLLARLKNAEHKIQAGEYSITHPVSPLEVLGKLIRGQVVTYSITIPEGSTIFEIARIFEATGFGAEASIMEKISDKAFIKSLEVEGSSLEGFLFPDTYSFTKGTETEEILKNMTEKFKEVFDREVKKQSSETGLNEREIIVLASMVEKEAALKVEKPVIAAVFFNRLKKKMRLECDPTVIYGIRLENPLFKGRLRRKHLRKKTPYNTYRVYGLPPGPICNPGLESIKAVLNPAKVDYIFFVSKNDGTHKFSKTFKEHNRAVYTYQKK